MGVTPVLHGGTPEQLRTALTGRGLSGWINTALIERVKLTIRQSVAALLRRTWSTAQEAPQLLLHLEWWRDVVSLRTTAWVLAHPSGAATGTRWQTAAATLSPMDAGDGGGINTATLDRAGTVGRSAAARAGSHHVTGGSGTPHNRAAAKWCCDTLDLCA